ncbi:MAG: hypothetical protein IJA79_08775 [Desulfovibrio sp.]|nr:hypothetical protein [Desulfovibrio sp.]
MFYDFIPDEYRKNAGEEIKFLLKNQSSYNYIHKTCVNINEYTNKIEEGIISFINIAPHSFDSYIKELSKKHCQNIRTAENKIKKNKYYVICEATTETELHRIYDLLAITYAKNIVCFFIHTNYFCYYSRIM